MNLHLGSGDFILEGFENYDRLDYPNTKFIDLEKSLPFKDNSINIIVMSHSLTFIYNRKSLIKELYRILKPNGYLRVDDNPNRFYINEEDVDHKFPSPLIQKRSLLYQTFIDAGFSELKEINNNITEIVCDNSLKSQILKAKRFHEGFAFEVIK